MNWTGPTGTGSCFGLVKTGSDSVRTEPVFSYVISEPVRRWDRSRVNRFGVGTGPVQTGSTFGPDCFEPGPLTSLAVAKSLRCFDLIIRNSRYHKTAKNELID